MTLRLRRLWRSRHSLLAALERGPHVVCHGDLNLTNIYFLRTSLRKPVLIDCQFVGEGAPGEDAGNLFWAASGASHETGIVLDDRDAADLDHLMFDSYISGLREGGWSGPWQQARLGYCLRYVVSMPFAHLPVAWLLLPRAARLVWPPPADLIGPVAHSCLALRRILDLGDEALSLLPARA